MTESVPAAMPIRRLAAVLLADVAGYSRLMESDDAGTHLRLREIRAAIIDPALARHQGRPVRSKGDDLLAEFASATEALACAIEIQRGLQQRNAALPPAERMQLRIGINLGDILVDGPEIAGDGVNVAARLQGLAEPGEIAISAAVRDQVRQRMPDVVMNDAGEFRVKNISRPIRVYRIRVGPDQRSRWERLRLRWQRRPRLALPLAGAVLLILVAYLLTRDGWAPEPELQSIALLPTRVQTDGAGVARALTEALPAGLRQALGPEVHLVTGEATQAAAATADVRTVGRALGVRFLLSTTVIEAGPRLRVSANLVDSASRSQLWSEVIEVAAGTDGALPPELVARLLDPVASHTRRFEVQRLAAVTAPGPALLLLRAQEDYAQSDSTPENLRASAERFTEVLQLAPHQIRALTGAAESWAYLTDRASDDAARRLAGQRAEELTASAIVSAPNDGEVWRVRSLALFMNGKLDASAEAIERSLRLNPYSGAAYTQRGLVRVSLGQPGEAVQDFDYAIRLAPTAMTVGEHLYYRARALLLQGRYQEAADAAARATAFVPEWPDYLLLTAAYAMAGDLPRAHAAKAELMRLRPGLTIGWLSQSGHRGNALAVQQREQHLLAGLRRAGVPE
jgi:adenylate cyclase